MKICVVGLRGVPGVMGGVESHCEQLLPRVVTLCDGHDFVLVARRPYVSQGPYDYRGIKVVPLPALRSKYFEALSNTLLGVFYARFVFRADVLHIHAIGPALLGPLSRALGMKLIVTHHGSDYQRAKWNRFAKLVLRFGEWCAIIAASTVIVVSRSLAEDLRQRHRSHAAKIEYVPNGATDLSVPGPRLPDENELLARFGIEKGGYVIAVGRLVPEKAFHDLIAAFKDTHRHLKLIIVGKADHLDPYSTSLMLQANDRIVFTGFQDHAALRILYENACLFVLPSYHEGLPIAALEAAIIGVPLILSDIAPHRDIDLSPACYFPAGNVEALRQKLWEDPELFRPDSEAIGRRFDWGLIAQATARIYQSVLGEAERDVRFDPANPYVGT